MGSDPLTGEPRDPYAPNPYELALRSGYFGQRAGGTLVYGTGDWQLFAGLEGGLNLAEWRHAATRMRSTGDATERSYLAWLQSFAGSGQLGLTYQPWHLSLRLEGAYEYYRAFTFERPIEFMGRVSFDQQLLVPLRLRTFVDRFSAHTATFTAALSGVW